MTTEKHDAIVTAIDADEPNPRGRIRVACAGIVGDEDTELPMWVEPMFDWGWFYVPDIGEVVEVEVVTGLDSDEIFGQSTIDNLDIKWHGVRRSTDEETEEKTEPRPLHEDFTSTNYGKRRGFATPNGHIIYFDDTPGGEKVHMTWKQGEDGDAKYQFISMDETGAMILSCATGTMIYMNPVEKTFTVIDENSNVIGTSPDGIKLVDKFSNIIELKEDSIQILAQAAVSVMGGVCDIKTGTVNILDGADAPLVRGTEFKTWAETHTHVAPSGGGATATALPPLPPEALSVNAKVGI